MMSDSSLYCCISLVKLLPSTEIGSAMTIIPQTIVAPATILPAVVLGTASP